MFGLVLLTIFVVLFLPRQLRWRPVRRLGLILGPLVAVGIGLLFLTWEGIEFSRPEFFYIGAQIVVAVVAGVGRGAIITLVGRGPMHFAWRRGGWAYIAAWIATFAARLALDVFAIAFSASHNTAISSVPAFFGVTLAVQNVVIAIRLKRGGMRFIDRDMIRRAKSGGGRWRSWNGTPTTRGLPPGSPRR
jgi:branched-subunit amino acid ABC-type transport system permease component